MMEVIATYPDIYAEWSVGEGLLRGCHWYRPATGSRAFCYMNMLG